MTDFKRGDKVIVTLPDGHEHEAVVVKPLMDNKVLVSLADGWTGWPPRANVRHAPVVEPTNLGAIVRDSEGEHWLRVALEGDFLPWRRIETRATQPIQPDRAGWPDIKSPTVVHDGWDGEGA